MTRSVRSGAQDRRHFIREWRQFRKLTQTRLAERADLEPPSISQLESGKQGYSEKSLQRLAKALDCDPAELLWRNPLDPAAPWVLWDQLTPDQQHELRVMLEALVKSNRRKP